MRLDESGSAIDFNYLSKKVGLPESAQDSASVTEERRRLLTSWDTESNSPTISVNTPHALVFDDELESGILQNESLIPAVKADYSTLLALLNNINRHRAVGPFQVPRILGAGGLVVYQPKGEVLLQVRNNSDNSGKLHVFGGNFEPNLKLPGQSFDANLKLNAERELHEETGAVLSVEGAMLLIHKERPGSFGGADKSTASDLAKAHLPIHFLGVSLDQAQYDRVLEIRAIHAEGRVIFLSLEELKEKLLQPGQWVPAGWVTVMFWLFIGAPCSGGRKTFSSRKAKATFREILSGKKKRWFNF